MIEHILSLSYRSVLDEEEEKEEFLLFRDEPEPAVNVDDPIIMMEQDFFSNNADEDWDFNLLADANTDYCSSSISSLSSSLSSPFSSPDDIDLWTSKSKTRRRRNDDSCNALDQPSPPSALELPQLQLPPEPVTEPRNPLLRQLFPFTPPFFEEPECESGQKSFCCPNPSNPDGTRDGCTRCKLCERFATSLKSYIHHHLFLLLLLFPHLKSQLTESF
jgi:hypothetical protein